MKRVKSTRSIITAVGLVLGISIGLVLNPSEGLAMQSTRAHTVNNFALMGASQWTPPDPAYRIAVETDGIFELDYDTLNAAGLPVGPGGLDPRTFRLFWMGQEMAIRVEGEGDGLFEYGDVVLFFGRSVDSLFYEGLLPANKYTGNNVYWLTYDPTGAVNGLRMTEKDGSLGGSAPGPFLHTEHLEQNFDYQSALPFQHDADHWYWHSLPSSAPRDYSFTANNISSDGTLIGTLAVNLQGVGSVEHDLRIEVNGNEVLASTAGWGWGGEEPFGATVEVPQAYVQEGSNTITLELMGSGDVVYNNWLEVGYYDTYVAEGDVLAFGYDIAGAYRYEVSNVNTDDIEVYDVSDMTAVQRFINTTVTGSGPYTVELGDTVGSSRRYLALSSAARLSPAGIEEVAYPWSPYALWNLLDVGNSADYIIISHSDFWAEAERLAAHRGADHGVALVDVQEIYDYFNGGLMSAEAIHDFLAYAYYNWQSPPSYVVLLGDGTSDMRNYMGNSAPTFIPPYLRLIDEIDGETAADNRFVTVYGDDIMPDIHIGRLPANTPAEADAMISKIIAYETQCACGDWNHNVLFAADDLEGGGGNFHQISDRIADGYDDPPADTIKYLPEPYASTKIYMGQTCDLDNPPQSVECRNEIVNTLNTTGALLANYVGHGIKYAWAGSERMLDYQSLAMLDNGPCLPIMLAMACQTGCFHQPGVGYAGLGESATRLAGVGAVAYWGSTGNGLAPAQDFLDRGFFLALFHEGIGELGAAVTYAKQYLVDNNPPGAYNDTMDMFVLFGDPALKVKVVDNCGVLDSDNDTVPDSVEIGPDPANPRDTDGDGLPDYLDDDDDNDRIHTTREDIDLNGTPLNDDSDSDGTPNYLDYDPAGYLYDESTGQILSGGFVSASGPGGISVVADGSTGYYQFFTDGTPGVYTIFVSPPPGYMPSSSCLPLDPPPFDPTGAGTDPVILGSGENGSTGFLTSNACTPHYTTIDLAPGDPAVINNNFPFQFAALGSVEGRVWWDVDGDGSQDAGEPGIQGVDVVLSDDLMFSTTDAGGHYTFAGATEGTHNIKVAADEFLAGGTLEMWAGSPQDAAPDDVDSDGHEATHDANVTVEVGGVTVTDFGFDIPSSYVISKQMNTPKPVRLDDLISFTILITNTGSTSISVLPLQEVYDTTYLTYGYDGVYANPASDDTLDDGVIKWGDLTLSFGQDLAPGDSFVVVVSFTAQKDTLELPGGETEITAMVDGARADPDGAGPLEDLEQLPQQEASDGVQVVNPTAVVLASLNAVAEPGGVLLSWETVSEVDILGFNLLRSEAVGANGHSPVLSVNEEFIFAQYCGADRGNAYVYSDGEVVSGRTYEYVLEIVRLDGGVEQWGQVSVAIGLGVQLPLVM